MNNLNARITSLLRWSEKYTKTDMVYIAKGGFWLGISQFLTSLSAFALSIAFANMLSPDAYGMYKYILSINALLLIPTLSGIDSALTQSISRKMDGTVYFGLKEKIKWGFWGSLFSIIISFYYFYNDNLTLSLAFFITAIFVPLTESFDIYNSILQGKKLFKTFTIFNSATQLLSSASIIVTIFITQNILTLLFVYLITNTLLNAFFLYVSKNKYLENSEVDHDALTYGKKLSLLYVITTIAAELDKLLVFYFLGPVKLAIYTIAFAPTEQLKALLKNVQFIILPKIAENHNKNILGSLFKKTYFFGGIVFVLAIFYVILSPILFRIAFPKYPESIFYSQVLSISIVAAILGSIFYSYIEVKRSEKHLLKFHVWSNLINITCLFFGIYYYGLFGLIVSKIVSRYIILGLTIKIAKDVN